MTLEFPFRLSSYSRFSDPFKAPKKPAKTKAPAKPAPPKKPVPLKGRTKPRAVFVCKDGQVFECRSIHEASKRFEIAVGLKVRRALQSGGWYRYRCGIIMWFRTATRPDLVAADSVAQVLAS